MKSHTTILILVMILIFGCSNNKVLDNSFFYNTSYSFKEETCNPLSNYNTGAYKVYDGNYIYKCDLDTRDHDLFGIKEKDSTSVFMIMNKNHKIINEVSFVNTNNAFTFRDWFIGYDNNYLMALRTTNAKPNTTELISINLKSSELTNLMDLPKGNYHISEHPLSKNDILVFSFKDWAYILDIKNKTLKSKVFECNDTYPLVISKDGKLITYLHHNKVYLYNIKTGKKEIMYDLNNYSNYDAFRVYFKNDEELIVKGNKFPGSMVLEESEYLVIKNREIIDKGQINFRNNYKYY